MECKVTASGDVEGEYVTIHTKTPVDPNYKPPVVRHFEHTVKLRHDLTTEAVIIALAIVLHGCLR